MIERGLENKVVAVTGSTSGIGRAVAIGFAKAGAKLILHGRSETRYGNEVLGEIRSLGMEAKFCFADFSNKSERDNWSRQAWEAYGKIDVLCNNAGGDVLTGDWANESFDAKLDYLLEVDVKTTMQLSREIGTRMKSAVPLEPGTGGGCAIVNIGWDQASIGMEGESGEMFATTKGAIMSMTRSLAQTLAPEVRVNCVAPGWIKTSWAQQASATWQDRAKRQSLMNRWGTPQDIADAVLFLASANASFISGHILPVNGGFRTWNE